MFIRSMGARIVAMVPASCFLTFLIASAAAAQQRTLVWTAAASEARSAAFFPTRGLASSQGFALTPPGCHASLAGATFRFRAVGLNKIAPSSISVATPGHLPKWLSTTGQLSDSIVVEKTGLIGIGTDSPTSKLTVVGLIESKGGGGGIKFPDGTVQTSSASGALFSLMHDGTLMGNGTAGMPLGLTVPLSLSGQDPSSIFKVTNTGAGPGPGSAIEAHGAARASLGLFDEAGPGVFAVGGDSTSLIGFGGAGVSGTGGNSGTGAAGLGIRGQGGIGLNSGGVGVQGIGGDFSNKSGIGGPGVVGVGGGAMGAGNQGGVGILGSGGFGDNSATDGLAGSFNGSVEVMGDFSVTGGGTKNFKIDHPLDPENKYLVHAAIESSEVLNIYTGNVTTDASGDATVTLPDWFTAVNRDFRYQLTVVGVFAQAIVVDKIKDNRFRIKTTSPGVEVSWLVTALRSDAAMLNHPFRAEQDKPPLERGYYLSPDAYGQPEQRGVQWARHPQLMQQLREQRIEAGQRQAPTLPDSH